jgi:hypothetical protein
MLNKISNVSIGVFNLPHFLSDFMYIILTNTYVDFIKNPSLDHNQYLNRWVFVIMYGLLCYQYDER